MMFSRFKKLTFVFVILIFSFSFGCTQGENSLEKKYGEDIHYFFGLEALGKKDFEKAKKKFTRCAQKGSYYPARKSFEQLVLLGNVQERIKLCSEFVKKYDDDDAKLFACKILVQEKEFALALDVTEDLDLSQASNELVRLRLDLMSKKKDARLEQTIYDWFTQRRISSDHYNFYRENAHDELEEVLFGDANSDGIISGFSLALSSVQQFRIALYRGNYNAAYEMLDEIRDLTIARKAVPLTYQLIADIGRACVNGSKDNIANAEFFVELAADENFPDSKMKYYSLIYSGLLYNKNDNYRRRALKQFEAAIPYATDEREYDQALWYYLQSCLKISIEEAVAGLKKYCATWNDADYFDDFFDSLCVLLFSGGKWNPFPEIYSVVKDYASPLTVSKFAYLAARMIQEEFVEGDDNQIENLFKVAAECQSGTYAYYNFLAAKRLGFSTQQIDDLFFGKEFETIPADEENFLDEKILSARKLLLGYADFGFWENIYNEWLKFFEQDKYIIDIETVAKLSAFLRELDDGKNNCYSKSLRMISRTVNVHKGKIPREVFLLLYPQDFSEEVNAACAEFEMDDYVMYALIRTESFFEVQAQSHAGAVGLTQLMESTAADCAARLKVQNYDLNDSATNIRFGTYYLSNLMSRLDGSKILALFAYNAGLTNVRRWIRTSKIQFDTQGKISSDLFLETLPFAETRDYGRRVISAAAMYAWLYDGLNPCDIVGEMM